jgi:hypothetical protein
MFIYVFSTLCSPVVNFKTLKLFRIGIFPIRETSTKLFKMDYNPVEAF